MTAYIAAWLIWLQGNLTINPNSEFCNPDSYIQAHGIWHILTAISTIFSSITIDLRDQSRIFSHPLPPIKFNVVSYHRLIAY